MMMKINNTHELILDFIAQFRELGATQCFKQGMCYWFTIILQHRFADSFPCSIVYDASKNHFGCMIDDHVYDITGEVSDQYNWVLWNMYELEDSKHTARIYRDCIFKIPDEIQTCGMCAHYNNTICDVDNQPQGFSTICTHTNKFILRG